MSDHERPFDLVISGAHVIDAAMALDGPCDVGCRDRRIAALGDLSRSVAHRRLDAAGAFASAGWIDAHLHAFEGHHPLAIDVDRHGGIRHGVTTAVDAGSFTSSEVDAFRRVVERSKTRLLGFVNVSARPGTPIHGDPRRFDQRLTIETIERNRDIVLGVKVLASQNHVASMGSVPLDLAVQAARETRSPMMVHLGMAPPVIGTVLDATSPGDIVTHCFKGYPRGIMNRSGRPVPQAWHALERGVRFDTAHGQDSYTFEAHRQALACGFPSHSLSTDLHAGNVSGPVHSLADTMTKALHLGLPLLEVVEQVTWGPAISLGVHADIGALRVGMAADVTIFHLVERPKVVVDAERHEETAARHVQVAHTIRDGEEVVA